MRLNEEEAQRRLAGARVARLATAGGDGQPHLVPVTFAIDGDLIYTAVDKYLISLVPPRNGTLCP